MINILDNKKSEYNAIPLHYCSHCLSIAIINFSEDVGYCKECGSTSTEEASIKDWEALYEAKYGYKYINK